MCTKTTNIYYAIKNIMTKCVQSKKIYYHIKLFFTDYPKYPVINTECVQFKKIEILNVNGKIQIKNYITF